MKFSDDEIAQRLRLGEKGGWEFKAIVFAGDQPRSPRRDDLADEIAAFANADGGVLLCGSTDAGDMRGMSRPQMDALDRLVVEACTEAIRPRVLPGIFRRELEHGKSFLLVDVPRGHAQHDSPGGSFQRVGGSKRRMTGDERLRLAHRRRQARFPWFDQQPVPDTGFRTLDEALWKPLLSAEGAADPRAALETMGLLTRGGGGVLRASVAGVLLCCRSPEAWLPNACITATRYRGRDRTTGQADAQTIGGPLQQQIAHAAAFAIRNMRVSARKEPARVTVPEYSERAIFETLVNAVAHRDYSVRGSRIRLSMFDDRLEIQSPGGLPNNLTVDSLPLRQSARNELLVSMMGRLPVGGVPGSGDRRFFVERRGYGAPGIVRETEAVSGRPAAFRLIDDAELCVILPAAPVEPRPARAVVTVLSGDRPLPGTDVLVLFPNRTWKRAATDVQGRAAVDLHTTALPMSVFVAAPGQAGHVERAWRPDRGALAVALDPLPAGGSVIFPEATGSLPGLTGELNPICDPHDRIHLYASNISINEGEPQPVNCLPDDELLLTDADGRELLIRIAAVAGRSALVTYRPVES